MNNNNRRQFLTHAGKALGGLALIGASPFPLFAAKLPTTDLIHREIRAMGTSVRVSIPHHLFTSEHADLALEALRRVDTLLSAHNEHSLLMQMNRSTGGWVKGRELFEVSRAALHWGSQTQGALDVTVLPAMRRFGFIPGSASDLDQINFTKLEAKNDAARVVEAGFGVDFGGIAKGYGVDEAVGVLRRQRVGAALLDAGGDMYALGRPSPDRRWQIGIRHPRLENALMATLELEDEAVATSGIYVQTRMVDGVQVSHLMDPRTGTPVRHVVSSTVVAPDAMTADGLATATSVMQPGAAQALIESLPGIEAVWVYADGSHHVTAGLKSRIKLA